jgi:hypothetical protein
MIKTWIFNTCISFKASEKLGIVVCAVILIFWKYQIMKWIFGSEIPFEDGM